MTTITDALTAARAHVVEGKTPIRAHVIITHDFDHRRHALMGIWSMAGRADAETLAFVVNFMAKDLLEDVAILERELAEIRKFAEEQLDQSVRFGTVSNPP